MTNNSPVTVEAKIDVGTFRQFALFDSLRRQKRWVSPVLFAVILVVSGGICFALRERAEQAVLLGSVLLTIGLGLPVVYFLNFLYSIQNQIKTLKLDKPRVFYTVTLTGDGVQVVKGKNEVSLRWDEVYCAYRLPRCTYLYATATRAYLLPDAQACEGADALWELIKEHLPANMLFDRR